MKQFGLLCLEIGLQRWFKTVPKLALCGKWCLCVLCIFKYALGNLTYFLMIYNLHSSSSKNKAMFPLNNCDFGKAKTFFKILNLDLFFQQRSIAQKLCILPAAKEAELSL